MPGLTHARFALAIVAVGVLGSAFAIAFRFALHVAFARGFHQPDVLALFEALPLTARVLLPALGGLLAGGVGLVASRGAGGHGVAEILEAVALGRGRISLTTTLWKALGSFLAIVTGGSIGREGPLVQFGAGAGGLVGKRFGIDDKGTRALVAAGTAAGFAAAYNTPFAAVLFVIEVVTGVAALDVVFPVLVATTVSTALTRLAVGGGPIYGARTFALVSSAEWAAFALLGALAGFVGPGFMALLAAGERVARRVSIPRPVKGAVGGAIVGLLAIALPQVTGNGFEAIQWMLAGHYAAPLLAVLLIAKAFATTASVSSGSPGGVFTPSLFLGAALGSLVGAGAAGLLPAEHIARGGYALVGMAALIAATTHAPITAAILGFELSGDYAVVLPLMLATAIATLVARALRPDSVYTEELRRRGIAWEGTLTERLARSVRARDIMERDPAMVSADAPVDEALAWLERGGVRAVYVQGEPVRAIDLHAAKSVWAARAEGRGESVPKTAGELAARVPTASADDALPTLSEKLWGVDWGEIPVVDPAANGRVLGVVTRRAVLGAFDRELLQRDFLYTRVVWSEGQHEAADFLELPPGQRVEVIAPPTWMTSRAMDPSVVRARFGVILLSVRREPSARGEVPSWADPASDPTVRVGDRWMVVGLPEKIEALRASAE